MLIVALTGREAEADGQPVGDRVNLACQAR